MRRHLQTTSPWKRVAVPGFLFCEGQVSHRKGEIDLLSDRRETPLTGTCIAIDSG